MNLIYLEKGQVLIFLDADVECNDGWMEPLLSRIASDRSVIATPHIDRIDSYTMAYLEMNENSTFGFGWNLYHEVYVKTYYIFVSKM